MDRSEEDDAAPAFAPALGERAPEPGLAPTIARAVVALAPGHDLAAVLADAPQGTTIALAAGRYTLTRPLTVTKAVRLVGAGAGACDTAPRTAVAWRHNVMRLNGEGGLGLFCRTSAMSEGDALRENFGDGVVAVGNARLVLRDADVSLNRGWGLVFGGRGPFALAGTRISHNKGEWYPGTPRDRVTIDGQPFHMPRRDAELDAVVPAWFLEEPAFAPCEVCGVPIWDEYERCSGHEPKGDCAGEWCGVVDCLWCEPDGRRRPGVVIPRGGTAVWE